MKTSRSLSKLIRQNEELLLNPTFRKSPGDFLHLLADDFTEFGMSGKVWKKKDCRKGLSAFKWKMKDFRTKNLAPDIVLATYRIAMYHSAKKKPRCSLRSSTWKLIRGRWQMVFHQGTPTEEW